MIASTPKPFCYKRNPRIKVRAVQLLTTNMHVVRDWLGKDYGGVSHSGDVYLLEKEIPMYDWVIQEGGKFFHFRNDLFIHLFVEDGIHGMRFYLREGLEHFTGEKVSEDLSTDELLAEYQELINEQA